MNLEFPYQIVTFLSKEPTRNEPVYYGVNGWYPQLALKRRFRLNGIDESGLADLLKKFFDQFADVNIVTNELAKPDHMPVRVIHIANQDMLKSLHSQLINLLDDRITSRYPDREGDSYYAHITAEYNDKFVIPVEDYENKELPLNNVWLLKDVYDENSRAYIKIK